MFQAWHLEKLGTAKGIKCPSLVGLLAAPLNSVFTFDSNSHRSPIQPVSSMATKWCLLWGAARGSKPQFQYLTKLFATKLSKFGFLLLFLHLCVLETLCHYCISLCQLVPPNRSCQRLMALLYILQQQTAAMAPPLYIYKCNKHSAQF